MDLSKLTDALEGWLNTVLHVDWLSTAITIVIVLVVTSLTAHGLSKLIKKLLHVEKNLLPAYSIFVNIGRVTVWIIGICVILASCFDVNVGAAVTALGVGGIAVSLGFQSTLSNLISGLQIAISKLIVPGDHIKISGHEGTVTDMTWWNTTIETDQGNKVIVPNSIINTSALVKMAPESASSQKGAVITDVH